MTWEQQSNRIPTRIAAIILTLTDIDDNAAHHTAEFAIQVFDQDDQLLKRLPGDLIPHLTDEHKATLIQFMTDIRALATSQLLPPGDL